MSTWVYLHLHMQTYSDTIHTERQKENMKMRHKGCSVDNRQSSFQSKVGHSQRVRGDDGKRHHCLNLYIRQFLKLILKYLDQAVFPY